MQHAGSASTFLLPEEKPDQITWSRTAKRLLLLYTTTTTVKLLADSGSDRQSKATQSQTRVVKAIINSTTVECVATAIYDTICYFNVRPKADIGLSQQKREKRKNGYAQKYR